MNLGKHFTLSVREPHLCLCKQVGSRPADSAAGLRSNLFATQSIITHKNKQNFQVLKSRRQYYLFLENYPSFKGLTTSLPGQIARMSTILLRLKNISQVSDDSDPDNTQVRLEPRSIVEESSFRHLVGVRTIPLLRYETRMLQIYNLTNCSRDFGGPCI